MNVLKHFLALLFMFVDICNASNTQSQQKRDDVLVDLSSVDSSIIMNLRYFGNENFTGQTVPGYKKKRILLTKKAALALACVQKNLKEKGFSLVVYDAFRPQKAVNFFKTWAKGPDLSCQASYYPGLSKPDLFKKGYVAEKSSHSRGSTVDVTIIALDKSLCVPKLVMRKLKNASEVPFLDDGTVDMGGHWDFFHKVSWHDTTFITDAQRANREILRTTMKKNGFNEYAEEWWHYTFADEPYPDTYFDFDID